MKKRAFTLLEILISFLILSVITAGLFTFLKSGDTIWDSNMAVLDLQQEVRAAMDGMIKEIRLSRTQDITINFDGSQIQFIIPISIIPPTTTYSDIIVYRLDTNTNQILREHPPGTIKVLANNITGLSFCCDNGATCDSDCTTANIVKVQINANKAVKNRNYGFSLNAKGRLRNE